MGNANAACSATVQSDQLVIQSQNSPVSIKISSISLECDPGNWSQDLGGLIVLQSGKAGPPRKSKNCRRWDGLCGRNVIIGWL